MKREDTLRLFAPLFAPSTIAIVGVSRTGGGRQNVLIRRLRAYGYDGTIYPIHPTASEIDGLPAYPSLSATPEPVDYASVAVPAPDVLPLLQDAAGHVRFAQIISSGFGEVPEGVALQEKIVDAARAGGIRLIGPNCLGLHSPRGKVTFAEIASKTPGRVGIVSQSGGLGGDIVRQGTARGLDYSGLVTIGNCADLNTSDFVEYYLADPDTDVIGLYVESAADGRRLFELLRSGQARKPVVILKGGNTPRGARVAASHTGSLTGDDRVWSALARQTGSVLVDSLSGFLNALLIFQCMGQDDRPTPERVAVFGNGGGTSVLATDYFSRLGLDVPPLRRETSEALTSLGLPPGNIVDNPFDCPLGTLQKEDGEIAARILQVLCATERPDILVCHLNVGSFMGRAGPSVLEKLVDAVLRVAAAFRTTVGTVLVLRPDGSIGVETLRLALAERVCRAGIPVFPELTDAAHALVALRQQRRFTAKHGYNVPPRH